MRKIADISKFEGLQAVAHARMGIGSPLSVFNAGEEGPLNSSNIVIPEDVLSAITDFAQDEKAVFMEFDGGDYSLTSAGKRLGAALDKQLGPGWRSDPAVVAEVRQALEDKTGSVAKAWAKKHLLAEQVESTFWPMNADYAQHRGDLDYADVSGYDGDPDDDEAFADAIERGDIPVMKFEEASGHESITQPTEADIASSAGWIYDAVLDAAMK